MILPTADVALAEVAEGINESAAPDGRKSAMVEAAVPKSASHWQAAVVLSAVAVVLFLAGYVSWRSFGVAPPPPSGKIMLAVLPFQNLTGDPKQEYLADGLTEEMILFCIPSPTFAR